jgi:peptidoglycan-associated lipoprotein
MGFGAMQKFAVVGALCALNVAACAKAKTPDSAADAKLAVPTASATTVATASPPAAPAPNVASGTLVVSGEIARACGLKAEATSTANFAFDSVHIADDDKQLLAQVAKCLVEGALRGRNLMLVGRADARGEQEYNMSLGGLRSHAVQQYLHALGVEDERLRTTSRGELDADGADEPGYARDRRVDIRLQQAQ